MKSEKVGEKHTIGKILYCSRNGGILFYDEEIRQSKLEKEVGRRKQEKRREKKR